MTATSHTLRRDIPPFNILTDEEFENLKHNHQTQKVLRNEVIYHEGDNADTVYLLVAGKVKVYKEGIGQREQIVKLAKANDFIGYRAVMAGEKHSASAQALEDCSLIKIPKDVMFNGVKTNFRLAHYIIKSLAIELSFSRYRSVTLSQKQIRGRLAESLLVLRDKYGYSQGNTLNVNLSREDMANLSNMTTSNAIRTLSNFVSENIIQVHGREISIINEPALERISQMG